MRTRLGLVIALFCFTLPGNARQANTTQQPFKITIAADKPEITAGSNVCVSVTLMNDSSRDLDFGIGANGVTGLDPNYRFEVRYGGGGLVNKRVYPHPGHFGTTHYNYTLKPGETHSQDQCVSAQYAMRTPGEYTIQAFRTTSGNDAQRGEVASNIVTVTVVPEGSGGEPPFTIVIAPSSPTFKAGSDVCVQISLTNDSPQDLDLGHASVNGIDYQFRYEVHGEDGKAVPKRIYPYPLPGSVVMGGKLKPGDIEALEQCPSRLFDMSTPGQYTIQVFRQKSSNPKDGEIGSNVVTVNVVP